MAALPEPVRPRVFVGGYAVKMGFVTAIPGADLVADINLLAGTPAGPLSAPG